MSHAVWVSTVSVYTTLQDVRDAEMYALAPLSAHTFRNEHGKTYFLRRS
jgi:hypothetical protein